MSFASCALLNRLLSPANGTVSVVEMNLCALASSLSSRPTHRNGYRYREFFQGAFEHAENVKRMWDEVFRAGCREISNRK